MRPGQQIDMDAWKACFDSLLKDPAPLEHALKPMFPPNTTVKGCSQCPTSMHIHVIFTKPDGTQSKNLLNATIFDVYGWSGMENFDNMMAKVARYLELLAEGKKDEEAEAEARRVRAPSRMFKRQ